VPHGGARGWPQTASVPRRCARPTGDGDSRRLDPNEGAEPAGV
jgi:hypothetical protein